MPRVYYGRKGEPGFDLERSEDVIAVRTRTGRSVSRTAGPVPSPGAAQLSDGQLVMSFPEAGVEVYRVPVIGGVASLETRKAALRELPDVRFAGGVLVDAATRSPMLYTENLFVKFNDGVAMDTCRSVLREMGLTIKSVPGYASNAFFVEAPEGTGQKVFDLADVLRGRDDVEYCHPELVTERRSRAVHPAQWHLKKTVVNGVAIDQSASVEAAHQAPGPVASLLLPTSRAGSPPHPALP